VKSLSTVLVSAALGASMLAFSSLSAAAAIAWALGLSAKGPHHHSRGQLALGSEWALLVPWAWRQRLLVRRHL